VKLKKHLTSIVVILAAIAALIYAYAFDGGVTDGERAQRAHNVFPAFRRENITRIEIVHGAEDIVLERDLGDGSDSTWLMKSPLVAKADPSTVDNLVGVLDFASVVRTLKPGDGAGFEAPRARGTLSMGAVTYHFDLGGPAASPEGAAYLRLDGQSVVVVPRDFATELMKSADTYRERTIVPYLSIALGHLELVGLTQKVQLDRVDDLSFRFRGGPRVSRDGIDKVWRALAEMRAESFLSVPDAERAMGVPHITIVMTPKDTSLPQGELVLGGECPGHAADLIVIRRSPTPVAACAPKGVLEGLGTTRDELVDKHIFFARKDEVEELRLEASPSGAVLEIARKGSGWHQRAPLNRDLVGDEVEMANALVAALAQAQGVPEVPGTAVPPRLRATVTRAESHRVETVEVGGQGRSFARRLDDDASLLISPDVARKLEPRATSLLGREIWTPPVDGKPIVALETSCGGVSQELTRGGSGFTMRKPAGYDADNAGAIELAEAIMRAKAEAWVADEDHGDFALGSSTCRVSVTVAGGDGGARTIGLVFGGEGEGGVYARTLASPHVLVVPRSLRDLSARVLVDRNGFFVDGASLKSVTLARGSKSAVFTRVDAHLVAPPGGPRDAAEKVAIALGQLRADEVVHLGAALADEGFSAPVLDVRIASSADGGGKSRHFVVGRSTIRKNEKMHFARIEGVDATFAIAGDRLAPLFDAF
jgi:hypothetical protein